MTKYKCGHETDIIVLDSNLLSLAAYFEWLESVGEDGTRELCFECFNKKWRHKEWVRSK